LLELSSIVIPTPEGSVVVEAEVTELKSRGVKFEDYNIPGIKMTNNIVTAAGAKTAWFKDTEGNILAVSQRLT
jgi:hypothetical protein